MASALSQGILDFHVSKCPFTLEGSGSSVGKAQLHPVSIGLDKSVSQIRQM